MPNDYCPNTAYPRLLILLTDELEESVKVVNRIIDQTIQSNFHGDTLKNRFFISVIGYNHDVKELCSGWLKELDANPLRYETLKKRICDGAGGFVDVELNQLEWVDCLATIENGTTIYHDAIKLVNNIATKWSKDYDSSPIIIDISSIANIDNSIIEIEKL